DIGRDLPARGLDPETDDIYTTPKRARGTPPIIGKRRQGSLSSTSMLNSDPNLHASAHKRTPSSPSSNPPTTAASGPTTSTNADSSPGNTSSQSEQLSSFKDYYSHALIRPTDEVAVLWAYTPRADDEFALERGQMLKVKGIWDDGWATGVMMKSSIEEWEGEQEDGGRLDVKGKGKMRDDGGGDVKAFPLTPSAGVVFSILRLGRRNGLKVAGF
ncbi:hypothetical protein KEM56_000717, partial [Ascosphaera pollenicola]